MIDLLSLDQQRFLRKKYANNPDVQALLQEIKRIRIRYVGHELNYLSPIAENYGRRLKILIHKLNEDAAHIVVTEGVQEMYNELTRWSNTPVHALQKLPSRILIALEQSNYSMVSDVLQASESELQDIPGLSYNDVVRLEASLRRLGCLH